MNQMERDFHQNNCLSIVSEGHSAERPTAKKFISLGLAERFNQRKSQDERSI